MRISRTSISIVIITHNEAENIEACISSCIKVSDDIVIVDSMSSDQTVLKAKEMGAKVIESAWQGYGIAKNLGAENAQHNWILSVDADECLETDLIQTLKSIELEKDHLYGFRRLNHVGQTPIKHGEWNPDTKFRLYR